MDISNFLEELLGLEGWEARIRKRDILEYMVPVQVRVEETLLEFWIAGIITTHSIPPAT